MCYIYSDFDFCIFKEHRQKKEHTQQTGGNDGNNSAYVIGEQIQRLLAISAAAVQNVNLSA